jgi:hypothetical protein
MATYYRVEKSVIFVRNETADLFRLIPEPLPEGCSGPDPDIAVSDFNYAMEHLLRGVTGKLAMVDGHASMEAAMNLAYNLGQSYQAVAFYSEEKGHHACYIVVIANKESSYQVGQFILADEVH